MDKHTTILNSDKLPHEFNPINISLILGLIIISFGLYIIYWIYSNNKELEILDEQMPDSNRGAIIMMVLPFLWFFITYFLKTTLFEYTNKIINFIQILGWCLYILILLKYIYDFCISFGHITKTIGFMWFLSYLFGFIGLIGVYLGNLYFALLFIFPIVIVLAMQRELNSFYYKYRQKKDKKGFYH